MFIRKSSNSSVLVDVTHRHAYSDSIADWVVLGRVAEAVAAKPTKL
jgi:hypothetical protein